MNQTMSCKQLEYPKKTSRLNQSDHEEKVQDFNFIQKLRCFSLALWEFSRPHTIIGTSLQVSMAYALVAQSTQIAELHARTFLSAWLSCLAVNLYVVGLNQLIDLEVDRVNKPYLPLALGLFTRKTGQIITLASAGIAIVLSLSQGYILFGIVLAIGLIGTFYSIPLTFFKGSPIAAALSIATARGVILNLGAYLHFNQMIWEKTSIPISIKAFAFFSFGFGVVISLMKDIPDTLGDRMFGVRTLSVRLGQKPVLFLSVMLLTVCYFGLLYPAYLEFSRTGVSVLALFHVIVLFLVWSRFFQVNPNKSDSIYRYYMLFWKFFYLEYIVFPISFFLV